jgi:N-acetylmuramoyl-L-alanine amidase
MAMAHRIAISSAHSQFVRGASGPAPWGLDEVDESRRVVNRVAELVRQAGGTAHTFHDMTSRTQASNISAIIKWHRGLGPQRDRDVSVHFNAYKVTLVGRGVEVLHRSQGSWATQISAAISAASGLINRGPKARTNLGFLNQLAIVPSVLLEVAFVDAKEDCDLYRGHFEAIARAIAETTAGVRLGAAPAPPPTALPSSPAAVPAPVSPPASATRPTLRRGSTGEQVRVVQQALGATPDGNFGPITETHVRNFQIRQGENVLGPPDSIVGPRTWAALERVYNLPPFSG